MQNIYDNNAISGVAEASTCFNGVTALEEYKKDRYIKAFRAAAIPLSNYMAHAASARYGGSWRATFSVEEYDCHPDREWWAYGYIDLRQQGSANWNMIVVSTAGNNPQLCTIEDGEDTVITDIFIGGNVAKITDALLPAMDAWLAEMMSRSQRQ